MKKLNLNAIRIDGGTQPRERINMEVVGEYAEDVKAGIEFPPVVVFHDGAEYWLACGFHRWHAHKSAEKASIAADIRAGSLDDAKLFASGTNGAHGLRRTNADKRLAVLMALGVRADWSDNKLAQHVGVSVPFVGAIRRPEVAAKQQVRREETKADKYQTKVEGCNPITPPQVSRVLEKPSVAPKVPAAAPAADDAFSGFDPIAELEATQRLLEAADKRIESLTKDDTAAELNKQVGIRQGIEARLSLEMTKVSELQRELDSYGKWYAELRKVSGLQKRSEITKLVREAANSKSEAV